MPAKSKGHPSTKEGENQQALYHHKTWDLTFLNLNNFVIDAEPPTHPLI